jgi:Domain of unknown function (DUF4926)
MAINEYDLVVLTHDVPEHGLVTGDVGTVVMKHTETDVEVEFCTADGETVALLTLSTNDVRPRARKDLLHVRGLTPAGIG